MSFYQGAAMKAWDLIDYRDPAAPTLFLGMYFKEDVLRLKEHKGPKYLFWNGSDVSRTLASPEWHEPIKASGAEHACHNKQLADELKTIGIDAEISPTLFAKPYRYELSYEHSSKPRVFMTAHPGRENEYGLYNAVELFRHLPGDLYVYGLKGVGRAGNVHFRGWLPEEQWAQETSTMQGALRLNVHDGTSQIVIKAILRGQYAIVTKDLWEAYRALDALSTEPYPSVETIPNLNGWIDRVLKEGRRG
jgi:hypothetical protein